MDDGSREVLFRATIDVPPVPKGRPRVSPGVVTVIGGRRVRTSAAHSYTPAATRAYEQKVGWALRQAGARPVAGPLGAEIVFHTGVRADGDNLLKAFFDAANGVAFEDDAQVRKFSVEIRTDLPARTDFLLYRYVADDTGRH